MNPVRSARTKVGTHRLTQGLRLLLLVFSFEGCTRSDEAHRARVEVEMKRLLMTQVIALQLAAEDLERAAPVAAGRGWDPKQDAAAIANMKEAWSRGRRAYELVEGALGPVFPQSDLATDARYDDFLAKLGPDGDSTPFDDQGVIGMHAIERILWADSIPERVVDFEKMLPGYSPARMPESEEEAKSFQHLLAHKLVLDVQELRAELDPLDLDIAFVFRGLIDLTNEQLEKVDRIAGGREESRYAQATLKDLRANRDGCLAAYKLFEPWLTMHGQARLDSRVLAGFERLRAIYESFPEDAAAKPVPHWTSLDPNPEHAKTAFGRLFLTVKKETDDSDPTSLSGSLMAVADALAIPKAVLR